MTKPTILAIAAACALQGCIQYSDTVNRPQFSSFAAAGGQSADTPMFADTMAGNTYPATETAAQNPVQSGTHPNISYFFSRMCAKQREDFAEASCDYSINLPYQDEDVALVTGEEVSGYHGSGGYVFFLLDLKGKPGDILFEGHGVNAKAKRNRHNIIITYGYEKGDISKKYKKTINLKKKRRIGRFDDSWDFGTK